MSRKISRSPKMQVIKEIGSPSSDPLCLSDLDLKTRIQVTLEPFQGAKDLKSKKTFMSTRSKSRERLIYYRTVPTPSQTITKLDVSRLTGLVVSVSTSFTSLHSPSSPHGQCLTSRPSLHLTDPYLQKPTCQTVIWTPDNTRSVAHVQ